MACSGQWVLYFGGRLDNLEKMGRHIKESLGDGRKRVKLIQTCIVITLEPLHVIAM